MTINRNYRRYKDAYYIGQAGFDTGTDFATLALAGVTTVAGGAATKAALAAAIAGITGAHATVQKNFFENNARDAIFTVMDALREKQLEAIDKSKALPIAQYSMSDALQDLDLYYEMGTVLKAQGAIYGSAANSALIPPAGTVPPVGAVPPAGVVPPAGTVPPVGAVPPVDAVPLAAVLPAAGRQSAIINVINSMSRSLSSQAHSAAHPDVGPQ